VPSCVRERESFPVELRIKIWKEGPQLSVRASDTVRACMCACVASVCVYVRACVCMGTWVCVCVPMHALHVCVCVVGEMRVDIIDRFV
jgi:hypothetical protein